MTTKLKYLIIILFPLIIYSQYAESGELYFKGTVGYGLIQDELYTGLRIREDGVITKEIYINPGGGLNIEWGAGVHISSTLKTELDVSYQSSGDRFNNGTVIYRRFPVSLSVVKEFQRNEKYLLYGGMGIIGIFTPKYFDELDGSKYNIDYKNSYGGQIGIGIMRRIESEKVFFFIEGNYIIGKNVNWKSAMVDEVDTTPSESFKSLNSSGAFLNIGLGYYY